MDWECVDLGGFSGIVEPGCGLRVRNLRGSKPVLAFFFSFFRRDALKEQFGKEPSTVRCLAVKSALLGTRHPRKEKEAALQNVTGEPACLYCKILMTTQSEMEPSIKIEFSKLANILQIFGWQFCFAAQLLFLCEDVVFRAKRFSRPSS